MIRAGQRLSHFRSMVPGLALVVLFAAGGVWYYVRASSSEQGSIERLAHIAGARRVTRGRLSGRFDYAACQSDSSRDRLVNGLVCDSTTAPSSPEQLGKFAEELRGGQRGSATRDAHAVGVWHLLSGRADEAVAELREAVRRDPLNASALNDLAVALTAYAQRHDDPSVLIDAFVVSDSAVRADSTLREARFTHALLLEKLYLANDARADWNRYLQLDTRSSWAGEARKRVTLLAPSTPDTMRFQRAVASGDAQTLNAAVAADPAAARLLVEKELGSWGLAYSAGDAGSDKYLALARAVATPLLEVTKDALWTDAIAAIDQSVSNHDSTRTRTLANGHAVLERGITEFEDFNRKVAKTDLKDAQSLFVKGESPMSGWALLFRGRSGFDNLDTALKFLTAIRDSAAAQYLSLRSIAAQNEGLIHSFHVDFFRMQAAYDSAVMENVTTREPNVALRVGAWLSQLEDLLRGRQAGWRTRYSVLASSAQFPRSYQALFTAFDVAGKAAANDAPRLALRYCEQSISAAEKLPSSSTTLAYALRRKAELLAKLGQVDSARSAITASLSAAALTDSDTRPSLVAEITLSSEIIAAQLAPTGAEERLRGVVDEYVAMHYERGLPSAYLALAQARVAAGSVDSAGAAFDAAMDLMQRQRATVAAATERGAFLDAARSVIDQIVAFRADHDKEAAFESFEANRSRVLLERLAGTGAKEAGGKRVLAALQRQLANDDVVVSYAILPHELLVWVIRHDRFEQRRVKVESEQLEDLINRYQRSFTETATEPDPRLSERLYRVLIEPVGDLGRKENLFVIPDRWIHFVPFAALRNSSTKAYLVVDHAVSYVPSATILQATLARPRRRFSQSSKLLAVGNPSFDRQAFQLRPLPAAAIEARNIAGMYANQNLLIGPAATDVTFERLAPQYDVIHFAGHAVVGGGAPELSHLVLASDGQSGGALFSSDIARLKLEHTGLVVLSSCSTADGKLSATEGASSLARAFFAAGVPAVVSSLWPIDDEATSGFFVAFHKRLSAGDSPAVALQKTQIEFLGDGRSPTRVRSWAAFQLFGG